MTDAASSTKIDGVIARIDARISAVVDEVLHHPEFQKLEAAWRGLAYVVDRVAFDDNLAVAFLPFPEEELRRDLAEATEPSGSALFRAVYSSEYGQFGGKPYGGLFVNAAVTASSTDVAFVKSLAAVAAMAHAPVFVAAHPSLFQLSSFADIAATTDLAAVFEAPSRIPWNSFRETEDSRYVGVTVVRFLLRHPYRDVEAPARSFVYDEDVAGPSHVLWGSGAFHFAVRMADAFAKHRSYLGTLDGVGDEPPVLEAHPALGESAPKPAVEVILSSRVEQQLADLGFVPLGYDPLTSRLRFARAPSLQRPRTFGGDGGAARTTSFLLGTRLPYILQASRFAHYLKVIERERIGSTLSLEESEKEMNDWLRQFVVALDGAPAATRLKYPLRAARVKLTPVDGDPGWYRMAVHLQPHVKYLGQATTFSIEGRVEAR